MSFSLDLSAFAKHANGNMEKVVSKTFFDLTSAITKDIPVDTGRARNSFFPAINKFSTEVPNDSDKSGSKSIARVSSELNHYRLGGMLTFTSNLPYIKTLEYGLFVPKNSAKVVGGFSAKAPKGFVGLNIIRFQKFVDKNAKALNG